MAFNVRATLRAAVGLNQGSDDRTIIRAAIGTLPACSDPECPYREPLEASLAWNISSVHAEVRRGREDAVVAMAASSPPSPPPLSPPRSTTARGKPVRRGNNFSPLGRQVAAHCKEIEDLMNSRFGLADKQLRDFTLDDFDRVIAAYDRRMNADAKEQDRARRLRKAHVAAGVTTFYDCPDTEIFTALKP